MVHRRPAAGMSGLGAAWTVVYALMGIAAWIVWRSASADEDVIRLIASHIFIALGARRASKTALA